MEEHILHLQSLCRICTKTLGRVSYPVNTPAGKGEATTLIEECFKPNSTSTDDAVHPPKFCNSCYLTMKRMRKSTKDGTVYRTSLTLHQWTGHVDTHCTTCEMVASRKTGGRPKVKSNILGCPKPLTEHIKSIAGPRYRYHNPLTIDRFPFKSTCFNELVCKACKLVLDEPVELQCRHFLCYSCCFAYLKSNVNSFLCPTCGFCHDLTMSTFQPPTPLTGRLLQKLVIRCDNEQCTKVVYLSVLKSHLDSKCAFVSQLEESVTLDQILQQPTTVPPTQVELEAAGHVVRKILAHTVKKGVLCNTFLGSWPDSVSFTPQV